MTGGTVLVVEDDPDMRLFLEEELREHGYAVVAAAHGEEALRHLARDPVDAVVTDLRMPGIGGREVLEQARALDRGLPVILITAFGSIGSAVESIRAGARHYLPKPFRTDDLIRTLQEALAERRATLALRDLRAAWRDTGAPAFVAHSAAMRRVLDVVHRAAAADTPVLLVGESGTGKELLARELHSAGPRRNGPFLAVNCSAIPETLLESQLFGHRRGAFTDAREDRRGLLQGANGGTVLLDEIGDMPAALQGKILRVLQEKEVHPIGAPAPVPIDARIVAATHRNLEALVAEGRFRGDLLYRLNVIMVRVPPLRERPDDLLPLVAWFMEKHGRRLGRTSCTVSPEALAALRRHSWPGNVRELENALERALVLGRDDVLWTEDLPEALRRDRDTTAPAAGAAEGVASASTPLAEVERTHILETLREARGNKTLAARRLGLDRKTLYRKLGKYGAS